MNRYLVTYDITADDRRNRVCACLKGWGDHIQYSVFTCDLSPAQLERLSAELHGYLNHDEDQILLFDLGPASGRGGDCVVSIGLRYGVLARRSYIL